MAGKQAARKKFEGVKILTPIFRASYLNVFEPKAYEDGPEKYSVEMLISKDTDMKDMKDKCFKLCVEAWGKDKAKWPKNFRLPWKDGDKKEMDDGSEPPEHYTNVLYARADSKNPPGIFDQDKNDIIDKREFFSGCYARASLYVVPYENVGGKGTDGRSGLKFYLQGIQMIKKGEAFGNQGAKNDFEVVERDEGGDASDYDTGSDDDSGGF